MSEPKVNTYKVSLRKIADKEIHSRDFFKLLDRELAPRLESITEIELDFQDINIISRSFAAELHRNEKYLLDFNHIRIVYTNISDSVGKMIDTVKRPSDTERSFSPRNFIKFTDSKIASEYLESMV